MSWVTYCVLNHDLFSVYPLEYTVMKFGANLNLKEHQFFFTHFVFHKVTPLCHMEEPHSEIKRSNRNVPDKKVKLKCTRVEGQSENCQVKRSI